MTDASSLSLSLSRRSAPLQQNGKALTEEMRILQMKRLHRLCKDPSKRSEGTAAKLVEVTCALCHFFRTMPTQLQFEVR